jgi:hypothetical protein
VLDGAPSLLSRTGFPSGFRQVRSSGRVAEVTDNALTCRDGAPPGTRTPNPLILGPWSWLFVDNADYLRVSATANAHCLQLFAVIWMGFVTIKCPTDHGASAVSI